MEKGKEVAQEPFTAWITAALRLIVAAAFGLVIFAEEFRWLPCVLLCAHAVTNVPVALLQKQLRQRRVLAMLLLFDLAFFATIAFYCPAGRQQLILALYLVVLLSALAHRTAYAIPITVVTLAIYIGLNSQMGVGLHNLPRELVYDAILLFAVALFTSYYSEETLRQQRLTKAIDRHLREARREVFEATSTLEQALSLHEAVVNSIPDAVAIYDSASRSALVNNVFLRTFGESEADPGPRRVHIEAPEAMLDKLGVESHIQEALDSGEPSGPVEIEWKDSSGDEKIFSIRVLPVPSSEEKPRRVLVFISDITDRKEHEKRKAELERREGEVQVMARVLTVLRRGASMLQMKKPETVMSPDELIGDALDQTVLAFMRIEGANDERKVSVSFYPRQRVAPPFVDAMLERMRKELEDAGGEAVALDKIKVRVKGETGEDGPSEPAGIATVPIWVSGRVRALLAAAVAEGEMGVARRMLLDAVAMHYQIILERIEVERERGRYQHRITSVTTRLNEEKRVVERLQQLDRFRSNIITMVSHELRTPLTVMRSVMSLLEEMLSEEFDKGEAKELVERALRNADRMVHMLDRISKVALLESDSLKFHQDTVDIREVAESALEKALSRTAQPERPTTLDVPAGLMAWADTEALKEILLILLENAFMHTPQEVPVTITAGEYDENFLYVSVRDRGRGLSGEDACRIFERFYQADRAYGPGYGGLGLGLAVAQQLVESQGGSIWLATAPGEGCDFTFTVKKASTTGGGVDHGEEGSDS